MKNKKFINLLRNTELFNRLDNYKINTDILAEGQLKVNIVEENGLKNLEINSVNKSKKRV